MTPQQSNVDAALKSLAAFTLESTPKPKPHHSCHRISRSGPEFDKWVAGFERVHTTDSLSVALMSLKKADKLRPGDDKNTELDWWTDVIANLRTCARRN